jgi:hypothetical protein
VKNFEATKRASARSQQILCEKFSWVPLHQDGEQK